MHWSIGPLKHQVAVAVPSLFLAAAIVLWPADANMIASDGDDRRSVSQEGLYKSSLTQLNYGMLGFHLYETKDGKRSWDIESRFAEFHRKASYAFMREVNAHFFSMTTGNQFVTKSDFGRSLLDKEIVNLNKNVSIKSQQGYVFTMDALTFNGKKNEFYSEELVHMEGPDADKPTMHLNGQGLMANIDKELFILQSNVTGKRKLKTEEWLNIRSKSCEFFSNEHRSVFIDEAHSVMPDMNIDSDVLEIKVNEEEDESILARGNVVVTTEDKKGYADRVRIEVGQDVIILEGLEKLARVDSKNNRIEGKRIKLYTNEDRIEVEQAAGTMQPE